MSIIHNFNRDRGFNGGQGLNECDRFAFRRQTTRRKCGCDSCVTSLSLLRNTVNQLNTCCDCEKSHIFAYNTGGFTIAAGGYVPFDHVGDASGIQAPGTNGLDNTTFRVLKGGIYLFIYSIRGDAQTQGGIGTADTLAFQIAASNSQGTGQSEPGSIFTSNDKIGPELASDFVVNGSGILNIPHNTILHLQNLTGGSADNVVLSAFPIGALGSPLADNASFTLVRIC